MLLGIPLRLACHVGCYDVDSHCFSSPNIVSGNTDISSFPYINTNAPAIIFTSSLQMYPWDPLEEAPSHISIPRVVISSIDSPLSEVERSIAPDCRPAAQGTSSEKSENLPYVLKRYLMSRAERSFFGVLEQVTDRSKYYIFPQISLGNLVDVEKGTRPYQ